MKTYNQFIKEAEEPQKAWQDWLNKNSSATAKGGRFYETDKLNAASREFMKTYAKTGKAPEWANQKQPPPSGRTSTPPPPPNQSARRTSTPPPPNQSAGRGAPFNPDPTARAGSPGNSQTGYSTWANRGQPKGTKSSSSQNTTSTASSRTQQTSQNKKYTYTAPKQSSGGSNFSWNKRGGMWDNVPGYKGHFSVNVPDKLVNSAKNVAQVAFVGKDIFDRTKERSQSGERLATAVPKSAAEAGAGLAAGLKTAALASKVLPKNPLYNFAGSLAAGIGGYYAGAGAAEKIIKKFEQPAYTPEVLKYLRPNKP